MMGLFTEHFLIFYVLVDVLVCQPCFGHDGLIESQWAVSTKAVTPGIANGARSGYVASIFSGFNGVCGCTGKVSTV